MRGNVIMGAVVLLLVIIVLLAVGCYPLSKAKAQFSRAAVAYPELPAQYCAITYPSKDSLIKGDSVVTFDTLWGAGTVHFDTMYSRSRDTIWITKYLPGQVIRETIHTTDTVRVVNTAELALCSLERGRAIAIATTQEKEAARWHRIAKKRFWVILGMGAAMALGIFAMIRRKVVKKIPLT